MRNARPLRLLPLALALLVVSGGCLDCDEPYHPDVVPCVLDASPRDRLEPLPVNTRVQVFLDVDEGEGADVLEGELRHYLSLLWGRDVDVTRGAPGDEPLPTLWFTTDPAVLAGLGGAPAGGYRMVRSDDGPTVTVAAAGLLPLAHGAYAFLEELGARFFHPVDEIVPALDGAYLPWELEVTRAPAAPLVGLHLHLLHPLEYMRPFLEPGEQNLEDAKDVVDWLVKTGHTHLQWYMMNTVPWEPWVPHARAIVDYAHARGLTVGMVVQTLDDGSNLQNQFVLADPDGDLLAELEEGLDQVMQIPFDHVELALGEFFSADPGVLIEALNHATAYMADTYPETTLGIENHIGDYEELYLEYEGETRYYYFLPGLADERLINTVHTVFFFDLYRDWAMYEHESFHAHREFLLEQLAIRPVRYFPESAYWVTADNDVPAFLAEYIHARWVDISRLFADIEERGLPPLDGHVLYSSGHEWSYWMIDYLTAKMMWDHEAPLEDFIAHVSAPYGACADEVQGALSSFISLQTQYLFDERLVPYVSAEDIHDDLGYAAGIDTHPPRVPFEAVVAMSEEQRKAFESDVVERLGLAAQEMRAEALEPLRSVCDRSDDALAPWCAELEDSVEIVALRLEHSRHLYRSVLAAARGRDFERELDAARATRQDAAAVIARRELGYRYDLDELTSAYENFTRYEFGYLRQAHTQCLWLRQEDQVAHLIEQGEPASPFELRRCQD